MSAARWRVRPRWTLAGLVLGTACGALVGAVVLAFAELAETASPERAGEAATFGIAYGGVWGAVTGTAVGVVLAVATARPLPRDEARTRAYASGTLATAAVLGVTMVPLLPLGLLAEAIWVLGVLAAGPLCAWVAGLDRAPVDAS